MKEIMTVTGPILPEQLGFCQCHEHLMIRKGISYEKNPDLCMESIEKSSQETAEYARLGGNTLIDAQPGGCCRMECSLCDISKRTNIFIIASTGFHKLSFYPDNHWIFNSSYETILQHFLHELTQGMYTDTDIERKPDFITSRAGIIKTALDTEGLTSRYQKLFKAAAQASIQTDVPLMVHIEQGSEPLILLTYLLELGVNPHRIIFCHMDRSIEPDEYYTKVLEKEIFLEFDTIGRFKYHSDKEEIQLIRHLLSLGYEDQLLISLDTTRARLKSYSPKGIGLGYLLTDFIPMMSKAGITFSQIYKLTIHNCIGVFTK